MKLRNKNTGEIIDLDIANIKAQFGAISVIPEPVKLGGDEYVYHSLAELNKDWEDYTPAEPLIKDEKIRKAVRAWAGANDANVVSICALSGGWGVRYDLEDREGYGSIDLLFKGNAPLGVGNSYTIDELCGEEEE